MAFTANVTINADTDTVRLVTDPEPRGFTVDLLDVNGAVIDTKVGTGLSYEFANLSAGTFSVRAVLLDTAGNPIGTAATAGFTIADVPVDTLTVKSVSGVSVSLVDNSAPAPAPAPAAGA